MRWAPFVTTLLLTSCKKDDAAPTPTKSSMPSSPLEAGVDASTATDAATPKTEDAGRDALHDKPHPFCEAAFETPVQAILAKCAESERRSAAGRIWIADAQKLAKTCRRVFEHPERIAVDDKVLGKCAPEVA